MKIEITVALVGLLGALLGGLGSAAITYLIESKKLSEEGISRPSSLLHDKRVALCEEMIIATDKATKNVWDIWELTEYSDKLSDPKIQTAIKGIVTNVTIVEELARISSICKIYGSPQIVEAFDAFERRYLELMRDPSHINSMYGIDMSMPLVNVIRKEIGTDVLSEHLLKQLRFKEDMFAEDKKSDSGQQSGPAYPPQGVGSADP